MYWTCPRCGAYAEDVDQDEVDLLEEAHGCAAVVQQEAPAVPTPRCGPTPSRRPGRRATGRCREGRKVAAVWAVASLGTRLEAVSPTIGAILMVFILLVVEAGVFILVH